MNKKACLLLVIVLSSALCLAQQLKRKAALGIGFYTAIPDSLVVKLSLQNKKGAFINFVVPQLMAYEFKLMAGDLLTKVNGETIEMPLQLLKSARKLNEGNAVVIEYIRNRQMCTAKGKAKGKPFETNPRADITYDGFEFDGGHIRTIYKKPKGKIMGTVFYLQGISCYSVDNMQATDPVKKLLDVMLEKGFAIFLSEKAGVGDSYSQIPCDQMGFAAEVQLFRQAYKKLFSIPWVDIENIFLFGHS